jgi:hypothetical protein
LPPQSRKYEVGTASARLFVDTPKSQVVEVSPRGSEALGARASLLSAFMTEGDVKAAIARRAGLRPRDLLTPAESDPDVAPAGAEGRHPSEVYLLSTHLVTNPSGEPLPIIEIEAQAPDAARARQLATSAVTGLRAYLDSKAASEQVSDARRLRVMGLGVPQVRTDIRGPGRVVAIAATLFVFLAGCAGIIAFVALARGWREADEEQQIDVPGGYGAVLVGSFNPQQVDPVRDARLPPPEPPKLLTPGRAGSR